MKSSIVQHLFEIKKIVTL